ncbi:MAG: nucleoside-diphosphate kinase, partial [Gemmatimonadales bacterium]|nr:nucleoside-diphosphate kinase [Gemmatimonadales bacterium]
MTLGIIKPDAVEAGRTGLILAQLEHEGFVLKAARMIRLTRAEAEAFYEVHRGRPFYEELVAFMTSGPCVPMALTRDDAVAYLRTV